MSDEVEQGKIYLFEGWDCCGKTTLAQRFANNDPKGIYFHSPGGITESTQQLYQYVKDNLNKIELPEMRLIQIANNIMNFRSMNKLKEQGKNVYSDRSILSTVAYQDLNIHLIEDIINASFVEVKDSVGGTSLNYDKLFLLTALPGTVKNRMDDRGEIDEWDRWALKNLEELGSKYLDGFNSIKNAAKSFIIPTDHYTLDELYSHIEFLIDNDYHIEQTNETYK